VSRAGPAAPPGYTRFEVRDAMVVARTEYADGLRDAMREVRTLHCWASTVPGAKAYHGRATAWGARLPGTTVDIVVRHAHHGGLLAPITGDRFLWPGRAPWELSASERLRAAKVRTPRIAAYVLYPVGFGFCRGDVATERLPDGGDLPALWRDADGETQRNLVTATAELVRALSAASAHHEDLNAKNVYLTRGESGWRAYALDVDRVRFLAPGDDRAAALNLARLDRSLRKARTQFGLEIPETALDSLAEQVGAPRPSGASA
jgi:hypothetical protein